MWIHPVVGGLAVTLLLWLGIQGARSRHRRSYAGQARVRHRRASRYVAGLVVLAACLGTASALWLRPDLRPMGSFHFWLGWGTCLLTLALAWSGPQVPTDPDARAVHPLFGIFALVFAALTATLGLGLLP